MTNAFMARPESRIILQDAEERLFRRVHPTQIKEGRPSKTTFVPRPADNGLLSVDRSSIYTAVESYNAYAASKGFVNSEGGVWAVSVGECADNSLSCLSDPLEPHERGGPNPAHSLVDFTKLTEPEVHNVATALFVAAKARGRLAP